MRRRILEWALWIFITSLLGVVSLAAASLLVPRSQSFLAVGNSFFALLTPGWLDLGSNFDATPDAPAPLTVNPRNIIAPKVTRSGSVKLPGFTFVFCLFANSPAMWSMRISLFVPLVATAITIGLVFYRLKRVQPQKVASADAPSSSNSRV